MGTLNSASAIFAGVIANYVCSTSYMLLVLASIHVCLLRSLSTLPAIKGHSMVLQSFLSQASYGYLNFGKKIDSLRHKVVCMTLLQFARKCMKALIQFVKVSGNICSHAYVFPFDLILPFSLTDAKMVMLGLAQVAFETSMYIFVYVWVPSMEKCNGGLGVSNVVMNVQSSGI